MCDYQKAYYRAIMPKVRESISNLKSEMGAWGKERRRLYLTKQLNAVQSEIQRIHARYEELTATDSPYINKYISTILLEDLEKDLKKIQSELNYLRNSLNGKVSKNSITPNMIEQARSHPFEDLIELHRGKALCPFHNDNNPSMGVKNNRYRCFACGESGDVINFAMEKDGLTFPEAVRRLL